MNNATLKQLLNEYEIKRSQAILIAEKKKEDFYNKNPRLQEIDRELCSFSLSTAKSILQTNNRDLLKDLKVKRSELLNEKEEIYQQSNISEKDFLPIFECSQCNDTGYITKDNRTEMCSCLKQKLFDLEYNKFNTFDMSNCTFNNFLTEVYSPTVEKEKYNSSLSPRENIKIIRKICDTFILNFDDPHDKNLLFTGNTGLGKTFLSNCIANELLKKGKTVLYQTAPVLLETIIDNKFNKYKTTNINNFNNQVLEADLLIIDDLGTECLNSMKLSELFTILNSRSLNLNNKITKTIISTNLSISKIFSIYEERIGSRIAGFYDIYYFFGEDLRLKKK